MDKIMKTIEKNLIAWFTSAHTEYYSDWKKQAFEEFYRQFDNLNTPASYEQTGGDIYNGYLTIPNGGKYIISSDAIYYQENELQEPKNIFGVDDIEEETFEYSQVINCDRCNNWEEFPADMARDSAQNFDLIRYTDDIENNTAQYQCCHCNSIVQSTIEKGE